MLLKNTKKEVTTLYLFLHRQPSTPITSYHLLSNKPHHRQPFIYSLPLVITLINTKKIL